MKKIQVLIASLLALIAGTAYGADPTATKYSFTECEGSLTPYPKAPAVRPDYPDTLRPVFINHVGRHGARYPASAAHCLTLKRALAKADSLGTITPTGRKLMALNNEIIRLSTDRWGALDSVGMAEQRGIATRMFYDFTEVFRNATVQALSSYSPRSMMSMFSFVHQLDRMDNHITFVTSTGRVNSGLVRPFDTCQDYIDVRHEAPFKDTYDSYFASVCPTAPIVKALGEKYPWTSDDERRNLAITEYYVLAGTAAMGLPSVLDQYYTVQEANALWSCFNLRQYLQRTATTISSVPADIAAELVMNLISTTQAFIDGTDPTAAVLRFGHAETLMPLLSLLRMKDCYYVTNYFDTVAQHWQDFHVVPMAANLQLILFRNPDSGRYYLRADLNEVPTPLIPGNDRLYIPWGEARNYLMRCVPLYAQ